MTKAQDIREVIQEQSVASGERRALEQVTDLLDETLAVDVPHRPEFKAQLRRQLMAEARRTMAPWYRRPAFMYSSVAVAAAAAVLAVGLNMWPATNPVPTVPGGPTPTLTAEKPSTGNADVRKVGREDLPNFALPDQKLLPGEPGPATLAGLNLNGVAVYQLSSRPDNAQFSRIAQGMDFSRPPETTANGFRVTEGARTLTMSGEGYVIFEDKAAGSPKDQPVVLDETAVRQAAQAFLVRAALPVPGLEPAIFEGARENFKHIYTVIYTPAVGGLPVVNARTVIRMTDRYRVFSLEAYAQTGEQVSGNYAVTAPTEAIAKARERGGGIFTQADLGYARTPNDQAIYLQPVWRVFGTGSRGERLVRFVPALAPR
ncbi:MAG TPA: hypothetical protein VGK74_10615 [Symbiobacteriaceae bacterium]|jgi:hypothetical protein